jgi:hypothetical protein
MDHGLSRSIVYNRTFLPISSIVGEKVFLYLQTAKQDPQLRSRSFVAP